MINYKDIIELKPELLEQNLSKIDQSTIQSFQYFTLEEYCILGEIYAYEGMIRVYKDGKWGFIDMNGNEVISCQYDDIDEFSEGLVRVKKDDKYGFIDQKGNEVVLCQYQSLGRFKKGITFAEKDDKYGFIDQKGRVVVPFMYDDIGCFSEELVRVKKDGKWGFVDEQGKEVIPCQFDGAFDFTEDRAGVCKEDKWCYIDRNGQTIEPFYYDWKDFYKTHKKFCANAFSNFMKRLGENPRSDEALELAKSHHFCGTFCEGLAAVEDFGKYGFIDEQGREVIPPQFLSVTNFDNRMAIAYPPITIIILLPKEEIKNRVELLTAECQKTGKLLFYNFVTNRICDEAGVEKNENQEEQSYQKKLQMTNESMN